MGFGEQAQVLIPGAVLGGLLELAFLLLLRSGAYMGMGVGVGVDVSVCVSVCGWEGSWRRPSSSSSVRVRWA